MCGNPNLVPPALQQSLKHIKVLHDKVYLVSVKITESPYVDVERRITMEPRGFGVTTVYVRFGYMDEPNVPKALEALPVDPHEQTFFLGREIVIPSSHPGMAYLRECLFAFLNRNERSATDFFHIPGSRVVEIGSQVSI